MTVDYYPYRRKRRRERERVMIASHRRSLMVMSRDRERRRWLGIRGKRREKSIDHFWPGSISLPTSIQREREREREWEREGERVSVGVCWKYTLSTKGNKTIVLCVQKSSMFKSWLFAFSMSAFFNPHCFRAFVSFSLSLSSFLSLSLCVNECSCVCVLQVVYMGLLWHVVVGEGGKMSR